MTRRKRSFAYAQDDRARNRLLLGALFICQSGCLVGPNYTEPRAPVADQWLDPAATELERGEAVVGVGPPEADESAVPPRAA